MSGYTKFCLEVVEFISSQDLEVLGKLTISKIAKKFNKRPEYFVSDLEEFFQYCEKFDILDVNWRCIL